MKTVTSLRSSLEGRVLRKGYHVYFSQKAVLFYYLRRRCKARKTKNKQESTKGSAKGVISNMEPGLLFSITVVIYTDRCMSTDLTRTSSDNIK